MPSSPLPLPLPREELEGDLRGDGSGNSWPSSSSSSSGRTRGLRAVKTLDPVLLLSVVVLDIAELLVVEPEEEMRSWRAELIFQPCESFAATMLSAKRISFNLPKKKLNQELIHEGGLRTLV